MTEDSVLDRLAEAELFQFADWPNELVPLVCAGVYAIWDDDGTRFLYVGMSGRGKTHEEISKLRTESNGEMKHLCHRLNAHASGRRSGDQFCVYVCDRLVIPKLTKDELSRVADGQLKLDDKTKKYIRDRLSYRFVETKSGKEALSCESMIKNGELDKFGTPYLNPGKALEEVAKLIEALQQRAGQRLSASDLKAETGVPKNRIRKLLERRPREPRIRISKTRRYEFWWNEMDEEPT